MATSTAAATRPPLGVFARPESAHQGPRSGRLQGCSRAKLWRDRNLHSQIPVLRKGANLHSQISLLRTNEHSGLAPSRGGEMGDPWQDEGFGGENDWDEGKESLETELEEGFADPDELDDEPDDAALEELDDE
jgi:hypothetical protein